AEPAPKPVETPKVAEPAPTETAPQQPAAEKTPEPVAESAKPEAAKAAKAETTRASKAETKAEAKAEAKKEKEKAAKGKAASSEPVTGQTYLQLAATSKHEADIMVDVLRTKGFKSLAAEIEEKHGTFRVLVGPIPEGGANKTRADLQASGFPGNAAIRRTF
ncbi:MAG: SPOR domain-containing protein, partial [Bryobacteraceae bacterium]